GQGDPMSDDVAALLAGWGHEQPIGDATSFAVGDLNQDGNTDFADWFILRSQHIGNQPPQSSAIPEPAAGVLLVLTAMLLLLCYYLKNLWHRIDRY
ncbi:MAG: hypothetical protein ACR2NU_08735, partial [Aeoliella sp.]